MKVIELSFLGGLMWKPSTSTTTNDASQPPRKMLPSRPSHSPLRIGRRSSRRPIAAPPPDDDAPEAGRGEGPPRPVTDDADVGASVGHRPDACQGRPLGVGGEPDDRPAERVDDGAEAGVDRPDQVTAGLDRPEAGDE